MARSKVRVKGRGSFGGLRIHPDEKLSAIIGNKPLTPAQMTRNIWSYVKRRRLLRKD